MKPIVDEIARKLRDALRENVKDFEGLYVFGSQVKGVAASSNNLDIVVLFGQEYFGMPDELFEILFQMRIDYYDVIDLDVLPYTRKELESNYLFHDEVVNRGVFYGYERV